MCVCVWMQLGCSEWAIHAYAHNSYTTITYTHLFFYFRRIQWARRSFTGGLKQGRWNGKGEEVETDGRREISYRVAGKGKERAAKYYNKNGKEEDRFY